MFIPDYRDRVHFDLEKMVKVNLFESHRLFADLYCLLPGQEQRAHSHHDNDKFYLLLEGSGSFTVGDRQERLSSGALCVAPAGVPHGVRNDSDGRLILFVTMAPHPTKVM